MIIKDDKLRDKLICNFKNDLENVEIRTSPSNTTVVYITFDTPKKDEINDMTHYYPKEKGVFEYFKKPILSNYYICYKNLQFQITYEKALELAQSQSDYMMEKKKKEIYEFCKE